MSFTDAAPRFSRPDQKQPKRKAGGKPRLAWVKKMHAGPAQNPKLCTSPVGTPDLGPGSARSNMLSRHVDGLGDGRPLGFFLALGEVQRWLAATLHLIV